MQIDNCKKGNFQPGKDEIVIPSKVRGSSSIDEVGEALIDSLKDRFKSFSLSEERSLHPDSYRESIENFIENVLGELEKFDMGNKKFDFTIGGNQSTLIKKALEIEYFPKIGLQRDIDENIEAIIGAKENALERHTMKLGRALSNYFLNNRLAEKTFRDAIRDEIAMLTVIDLNAEEDPIVDSIEGLNLHIMNLLKKKFRVILRYLKAIGVSDLAGYMYKGNSKVKKYKSTLDKMYQVIEYKRRMNTLQGDIEEDWMAKSLDPNYNKLLVEDLITEDMNDEQINLLLEDANKKGDIPTFYDAMSAYLTLVYFDDLVKDSIGDYISSNKQADIIEEVGGELRYKYKFGKDTENRVQGWEVDVRDALREMGNFSKFLIQLIPLKDTKLTPVNFLNTFTSLFNVVSNFSRTNNMYKLLSTFADNPTENLRIILTNIHDSYKEHLVNGDTTGGLYNNLTSFGLNEFDFQVLEAVYDFVFGKKNSLYNIEKSYNRKHGITNRYSLVDSISGLILSSTVMNYLETTTKDGELVTRIKRKYPSKRELFNHLNSVNRNNISTDSSFPYTFRKDIDEAQSVYTIDLTGLTNLDEIRDDKVIGALKLTLVRVTVQTVVNGNESLASNKYGLLSKPSEDKNITIEVKTSEDNLFKSLTSFLNEFDVSTYKKRKSIVDNLQGANAEFMSVLSFIDDLAGTNFTIDENGLLEYYLFNSKYKDGVASALTTATRGLIVNDIHKKFEKELERTGTMYTRMDLAKFIADKNLYPKFKISDISQTDYSWKEIWKLSELGNTLLTLTSGLNWLQNYIDILHVMSGEISQASTRNLDGDPLPNYGLAFMGSNIQALLNDALHAPYRAKGQPLNRNPFSEDPTSIIDTVIDTDVRLQDGTIKLVKNMEEGELYYHAIMDKFILPLIGKNPYIIIQPTTYSDKTKFINYRVKTTVNGLNLITSEVNEIEYKYANEMKYAYNSILKNVLGDYAKIFPELLPLYAQAYVQDVNTKLWTYNDAPAKDLVRVVDKKLREVSENAIKNGLDPEKVLVAMAKEANVDIYLDTHFRINEPKDSNKNKNRFLAFNESLAHYALELYTPKELKKRLALEKVKFLKDLIKSRFKFDKVNIGSYGTIKNDTPVGQVFSLLSYTGSWAKSDGTIILAKTAEGDEITKISQIKADMQLNPLLERFFMVNSYLNNSMRMLLTGSEINHKNKQLIGTNLGKEIRIKLNNDLAVNLDIIPVVNKMAAERGITHNNFFESMSFSDLEELIERVPKYAKELEEVRRELLYFIEAFGQGAQLKRNVIIPATMRYYMLNTIRGIGLHMKLAIMDDIAANVFNFTGKYGTIDAHDGAAWINPITSILENWSLQENEVGTIKKPIWHNYDGEHMTASLVKFAAHTMTNILMRLSEGSPVSMRNMFRKMTNQSWSKVINDALYDQTGEVVLNENNEPVMREDGKPLKTGYALFDGNIFKLAGHTSEKTIDFSIMTSGNSKLFYMGAEGTHYAITNAGFENGAYYTVEGATTEYGETPDILYKVYHYFDVNNKHYRFDHILSEQEILDKKLHTVNNIYELHEMFGGIDSESITSMPDSLGDTKEVLHWSEASNYVVANIINNVNIRKSGLSKMVSINLDNYVQPLKTLMIDYLCNNSAIKNGAGNKNSSKRFYNDEGLDYITMDTRYYGILMDADHEADEAEMTEFSQVISALDAGGRLHGYVRSIYKALGQIALAEARIEMNAIEAYLKAGILNDDYNFIKDFKRNLNLDKDTPVAKILLNALEYESDEDIVNSITKAFPKVNPANVLSEVNKVKLNMARVKAQARDNLYDVIGKTILENIKMGSGKSGLAEAILGAIKHKFNLTSTHDMDVFKIPFSDDNIYSNILSTYASVITKKSIRKKYPGLGAVISPGYDVATIYDIGGKAYLYDDIKSEALKTYKEYAYLKTVAKTAKDKEAAEAKVLTHPYHTYFLSIVTEGMDGHDVNNAIILAYLLKATDDFNIGKYYYNVDFTPNALPDFDYYLGEFMPTDNIGVRYRENGEEKWFDMTLKDIEDYYIFKADPRAYINDIIGPVTITGFRKNLHIARNLAPTKVWWDNPDGTTSNIFDSIHLIRDFANKLKDKIKKEQVLSKKLKLQELLDRVNNQIKRLKAKGIKEYANTLLLLDELDTGMLNGKSITLHNTPAELIMSNIYLSKFGVNKHMSLAEILNMSKEFFASGDRQVRSKHIRLDFYDLVMLKGNGGHTYISIDRNFSESDIEGTLYEVSYWGKLYRETNRRGKNDIVVNNVYAMDDEGRKLFQVGRDIIRTDVTYDSVEGVYKKDGEVIRGKFSVNPAGEVQEYVEFVTKHRISQEVTTPTSTKNLRHYTYNINTSEMLRTLLTFKTTDKGKASDLGGGLINLTRKIIRDMYRADSYEILTINNDRMSISRTRKIKNIMENMALEFLYDPELSSYLDELYTRVIKNIPEYSGYDVLTVADSLKLTRDGDALIFKKGGLKDINYSVTRSYIKKLGKKRRASFLRSTDYTASRIPALTLQSFMNMRLVGFSGEGTNVAYVSHWLTWLQGSDYDIDKAYIMGLAFDDNGSYIGWSSLFDYTSLATIKASELLPMPNLDIVITETSDPKEGLDITKLVLEIHILEDKINHKLHDFKYENEELEEVDRVRRITLYTDIINKLGDNTKVYCKDSYAKDSVIPTLNRHHSVQIPVGSRPMALRNYVSSHILNTILHIRNISDAYFPVEMEDMRTASDNSPKGKESLEITLANPLSVYKMQYQNMTGKNVIAIAATGQKGMFMWNYYVNDVIKRAKEGIDYQVKNGEVVVTPHSELDFARFSFTSNRIIGRSTETFEQKDTKITMLPDINIEGILAMFDESDTPESKQAKEVAVRAFINSLTLNKLNPRIKTDIINSQMISAATDNAKELILAKINAGSKLAKCYLYLMSLGFDINDIVAFMTSDTVDLIDRLSNPNIFTRRDVKPGKIINDLREHLLKLREFKTTGDKTKAPNPDTVIGEALPDDITVAQIDVMLADVNEFKKVFDGANEFSNFGRMLSINQGLAGKTEDLEGVLQRFRDTIEQREKAVKLINSKGIFNMDQFTNMVGIKNANKYMLIANGNFDPVKWLLDEIVKVQVPRIGEDGKVLKDNDGNIIYDREEYSYRLLTSEYYNYIKHSINIFAAANYIPHFSSMFKLLGSECTVNAFSTKSRILQSALKKIRRENPNMYIDSDYYTSILRFASKLIITKYITENEKFELPINKGARLFNSNRQLVRLLSSGKLVINSEESIASFKYYFENVVIPGLLNGNLFDDLGTNVILRRNEFILSLTRDMDGDVPIWKTNINMSADSAYTTILLAKYSKALSLLSNVKFGSHNLADWFALYNLVVNNNRYGSDRLTKAFENFINEFDRKGNSLINRYLKYIGDMDHLGLDVDELFKFTARDLFLAQARPVSSLEGLTDPVVILTLDGVPRYYMRKGFNYSEIPSILPTVSGETNLDRLGRFAALRSYFLLGNPYSTYLTLIKMLLNADNPVAVLTELIRTNTINFKIECV